MVMRYVRTFDWIAVDSRCDHLLGSCVFILVLELGRVDFDLDGLSTGFCRVVAVEPRPLELGWLEPFALGCSRYLRVLTRLCTVRDASRMWAYLVPAGRRLVRVVARLSVVYDVLRGQSALARYGRRGLRSRSGLWTFCEVAVVIGRSSDAVRLVWARFAMLDLVLVARDVLR